MFKENYMKFCLKTKIMKFCENFDFVRTSRWEYKKFVFPLALFHTKTRISAMLWRFFAKLGDIQLLFALKFYIWRHDDFFLFDKM